MKAIVLGLFFLLPAFALADTPDPKDYDEVVSCNRFYVGNICSREAEKKIKNCWLGVHVDGFMEDEDLVQLFEFYEEICGNPA